MGGVSLVPCSGWSESHTSELDGRFLFIIFYIMSCSLNDIIHNDPFQAHSFPQCHGERWPVGEVSYYGERWER